MQFELTEALLDDILFSMEDQETEFYIDCREGIVVSRDSSESLEDFDAEFESAPEGRFITLPEWDSSSGFRLMERFAASFRNPLIRNELCAALNRGKGVFRAFKNTLTNYPEAEKLWFTYKEREMKREVVRWYNGLREEWGLKKIGLEPEETADLVLEDFRFREPDGISGTGPGSGKSGHNGSGRRDLTSIAELHSFCMETADPDFPKQDIDETFTLMAETGNAEFAGYITAVRKGMDLFITALEVKPEYRGLGIGKALLDHLLEKTENIKTTRIYVDLPSGSEGFSRALIREGFEPRMTRYCLVIKE